MLLHRVCVPTATAEFTLSPNSSLSLLACRPPRACGVVTVGNCRLQDGVCLKFPCPSGPSQEEEEVDENPYVDLLEGDVVNEEVLAEVKGMSRKKSAALPAQDGSMKQRTISYVPLGAQRMLAFLRRGVPSTRGACAAACLRRD